jgi:type II secretory pathway pseudopilin PulG
MNYSNKKSLGGFTLIETIVAIFIFMLVLTAIVGISGQVLIETKTQRLDTTAQYLLQEGVEYIRNNRDSALNSGATWAEYSSISGMCPATVGTTGVTSICPCLSSLDGCSIDPLYDEIKACNGPCAGLLEVSKSNGPSFYCTSLGTYCLGTNDLVKSTSFVRTVKMTPSSNLGEMYVDVTLNWIDAGGVNQSKTLKTTLFNW